LKKIISLFLAIILLAFSIPIHSYADVVADGPEAIIKYTIGNDETEKIAELKIVGTYKRGAGGDGRAYLVSLPYGSVVNSFDWVYPDGISLAGGSSSKSKFDKMGNKNLGDELVFPVEDENAYLVNEQFTSYTEQKNYANYLADEQYGNLKFNEGFEFPTQEVKGFIALVWYRKASEGTTNYRDIIYVQISTYANEEVDKTALKAQIDLVTGENESNWHKSGDRFNGKVSEYKQSGSFWTDMLPVLINAKAEYDKDIISQNTIDAARFNLEKAILKLIPASNINATELYEEINTDPKRPIGSLGTDPEKWFTKASWQEYTSAKASAQALLESLYDDEGKPTPKNQSSDTALFSEIENKASNLKSMRESMDILLGIDDTGDVKVKYDALRNLLRVYPLEKMNKSLFTDESYANYLAAYTSVKDYLGKTPVPLGEAGNKQYDELKSLYLNLWRGIHGLKDKKESITVTVKVVDTLGVRSGSSLNWRSGIHSIVLSGDAKTLDAAIDSLDDEVLSSYNDIYRYNNYLYVTSINGILSTGGLSGVGRGIAPLKFRSPEVRDTSLPEYYYQVQLHDGDVVTLAFLDQPTVPSSSGTGQDAVAEDKFHEYYRHASLIHKENIPVAAVEVLEGEELNFSAIYAMPHISTYSKGRTYPLSGATLFVSDSAVDITEIKPAGINTGIISDEDGNIVYGFYEPGYYALSIHDLGKNELKRLCPELL